MIGFLIDTEWVREPTRSRPDARPADLHCSLVKFTTSRAELKAADFSNFLVSVPTSIEGERRPDLGAAAQSLGDMGKVVRKGAIVVCEFTVYPGGHKEDCSWCLSGHSARRDFTVVKQRSHGSATDGRSTLNSGHIWCPAARPLSATSGHSADD